MKFFKNVDWKSLAFFVIAVIIAQVIYTASGADSAITTWKAKSKS